MDRRQLVDYIVTRFNDDELRSLCFLLEVDYEELAGDTKTGKVRELIAYLERRDQIPELIAEVKKQRPDIPLPAGVEGGRAPNTGARQPSAPPTASSVPSRDQAGPTDHGQPLSPIAYVAVSAAGLLITIGLLLLMIFSGPRLIRQGMDQQVFYVLLIPLGLATAAFVFGAMRSYATLTHQSGPASFSAAGPIVAAILVVVGGFFLVPTDTSFDVTIRVRTAEGPFQAGYVTLIAGPSTLRQPLNSNGEAEFKGLQSTLREATVRVAIWHDDGTRIDEVERTLTADVLEIDIQPPPPTPVPITRMPDQSFNIAVAQFTMLHATGEVAPTTISDEFTGWLYSALRTEAMRLADSSDILGFQVRGPDDIGPITGVDAAARAERVAEVAEAHNATVLIYGLVREEGGGEAPFSVALEFYVSERGFDYGSEVAGPEQLGRRLFFALPLEPADETALNLSLKARTLALAHIVEGLARFFFGHYAMAATSFNFAATRVDDWRDDEGKEVAFLLEGIAWLRAYDPCTEPGHLDDALEAFGRAEGIDDSYARIYLVQGAILVQQAQNIVNCEIVSVEVAVLDQAEAAYLTSLRLAASDPSQTVHTVLKANYGLGEVNLLAFEHGPAEGREASWNDASSAFGQVLATYDAADQPLDLTWFAAGAHANLGLLAGHVGDWATMIDESEAAIRELDRLPLVGVRSWKARYWANIGLAEKRQESAAAAKRAYEQALELGENYVSQTELDDWQRKLDDLEAGGSE